MGLAAMHFPSKSFPVSSAPSLTTKNAWAQLVRRRFYGQNLVKACQRAWPITERQARGLVYAECSQTTIDAVLQHDPIEGFALSLEIAAIVTGVKLEEYFAYREQEAARARAEWEATERRLAVMRAGVSRGRGADRGLAGDLGTHRAEAPGVGAGAQGQALDQPHTAPRRSGG